MTDPSQHDLGFGVDAAVARRTDPATSHAAAAAHAPAKMRTSQRRILAMLRTLGPMIDEDLYATVNDEEALAATGLPRMSPSGVRSRRAELVKMGLVESAGTEKRGNYEHTVWQAVAQQAR
jgi:hypothetical protein